MTRTEKLIIKNQFVGISEYMILQTKFNIDIDKRVTRHDKDIIDLKKQSGQNKDAIGSLKKYFVGRKIKIGK